MVSLAFHLFVGTVISVLLWLQQMQSMQSSTHLLQTVFHYTVVIWCCFFVLFFHLMFAGRPPFAFLRWFRLVRFFHLVSAVCLPDQGSPFSFATNICGLFFFFCHRHLCTVSLLHGLFFCRPSCQTFCLCLLSFLMSSDAKEHIRDTNCNVGRLVPWLWRGPVRVPLFSPKPGVHWSKMCTGQPSFCLPFGFYFCLGCFH